MKYVLLIGVCCATIMATYCTFTKKDWVSHNGQEKNGLESSNKGSYRYSKRLSGSSRMSEIEYPKNCLIIWTAEWCSTCSQMKTIGDKLKAEGFDVFYIDFDAERKKARSLGIKAVPTAIIYTDSKEVERIVGVTRWTKEKVEKCIREVLCKNIEESPPDYEIY